ncbi:sulfite exporter TauE/SafE family protein [Benzoatithermus flavus]|uniref:Probable membrane transporter protein n=1 Tax=Benzoatithermus flavus TaxID=3108223 RepID=A0ABU8XNY7_9PROT
MSFFQILLLFVAGFAGGTVNAIAGGATFFTFPAMLAVGIPPVTANASNTTALVPASLVAAWAQRRDLADIERMLPILGLFGLAGGAAGAVLLLVTSDRAFMVLVPFLLLVATLLFAFSPRILTAVRARHATHQGGLRLSPGVVLLLLAVMIYGGYFGAGLGIMLLAGLAIAGLEELRVANAVKNGVSALVNGVAVAIFIFQGVVVWPAALTMMAGAALGGFAGARIARRLPQRIFRIIVIGVGALLTVWYFLKL